MLWQALPRDARLLQAADAEPARLLRPSALPARPAAESLQKGAKKVAASLSLKGRSASRDGRTSAGDEQPVDAPAA